MNDSRWTRLEQLWAAARHEAPPPVDVTRAVLARIARQPPREELDRTLAWCALGSLVAAGIMVIVTSGALHDALDPLADLMQSCDVVLR